MLTEGRKIEERKIFPFRQVIAKQTVEETEREEIKRKVLLKIL